MRATTVAAALTALFAVAHPASAEVRLTIENGQVTLSAKNATIAQILAEWSRVGQTRIVNAERIAAAPITMELSQMSEAQAIDIILRTVSGYVLAPRATAATNVSRFDRIYIVPTAAAPRPVAGAAPAPPSAPSFPQQRFVPPPPPDDLPDDQPVGRVPAPPVPVAGAGASAPAVDNTNRPQPGFMVFPAGQPAAPANGGNPFGVATPGMVVPTPSAPATRDIRATPQPQ
jgi:hypothetical protein